MVTQQENAIVQNLLYDLATWHAYSDSEFGIR
jgi:hypothetical protein